MFDVLIDSAQKKWPPNRVAIALTVFLMVVLTPLLTAALIWVQAHFPGLPPVTTAQLVAVTSAVLIAVITAVVTLIYKLIDGWQKEQAQAAHVLTAHINATGQVPAAAERLLLESGPLGIPSEVQPVPGTHAPPQA